MIKRIITLFFLIFIAISLWAADLDEIIRRDSITVGIRKISTATYLGEEFINKGFCYDIASAFARDLGVNFKLQEIENFINYWTKDGEVVFKAAKIETPDIYKQIDLAADIFTLTDSRKKHVNMVPFIENTEIFVGRKGSDYRSYEDLRGLRIVTIEALSFFQLVKDELTSRNIPFVVNKVIFEESGEMSFPSGRAETPENAVEILIIPTSTVYYKDTVYNQLLLNHADLTIQDSFSFFLHYSASMTLQEELRTMFTLSKETGHLAFCTSYETTALNKKLSDFITRYKETYEYEEMFKSYMSISYTDYQSLLNITQKVLD